MSQQLWSLLIEHLPSSLLPWLSVWKVCISVCPWSSCEDDQEVEPRRNHVFSKMCYCMKLYRAECCCFLPSSVRDALKPWKDKTQLIQTGGGFQELRCVPWSRMMYHKPHFQYTFRSFCKACPTKILPCRISATSFWTVLKSSPKNATQGNTFHEQSQHLF